MKRSTQFKFFFCLISFSILSQVFVIYDASAAKGLFIYWRGETPCGQGIKAELASKGIQIDISEFNAGRETEKLTRFIDALDENQYDFIYTFGTTVSLATAAKVKKTPIVFGIVASPVKAGLISDWKSSGKNITGISHIIPYPDQFDLIFQLGKIKKVGFLYNDKEKNSLIAKQALESGLRQKGIPMQAVAISSEAAIDASINQLIASDPDLIYLPSDSFVIANAKHIITNLNAAGIPTYGAVEKLVKSGAMVGIVASYDTVGRQLADKIQQILNGRQPARIPSNKLPAKLQTILINAKTAEMIGADIPYDILSLGKIIE